MSDGHWTGGSIDYAEQSRLEELLRNTVQGTGRRLDSSPTRDMTMYMEVCYLRFDAVRSESCIDPQVVRHQANLSGPLLLLWG